MPSFKSAAFEKDPALTRRFAALLQMSVSRHAFRLQLVRRREISFHESLGRKPIIVFLLLPVNPEVRLGGAPRSRLNHILPEQLRGQGLRLSIRLSYDGLRVTLNNNNYLLLDNK